MAKEIKIPEIAEGVESATVTEVLVSKGDKVEKEQALITVESDKASVEIPSPQSGTVKSIEVSQGDEVSVGGVIVTLDAADEDGGDSENGDEKSEEKSKEEPKKSEEKDSEEAKKEPSAKDEDAEESDDADASEEKDESEEKTDADQKKGSEKKDEPDEKDEDPEKDESEKDTSDKTEKKETKVKSDGDESEDSGKAGPESDSDEEQPKKSEDSGSRKPSGAVAASPAVRRLARELSVDIDAVGRSLDSAQISEADVKAFAKKGSSASAKASPESLPDFGKWGEIEKKPLTGIRATTAKNVSQAWTTIPHVFQFDEAEIRGIEKYIEEHKPKAEEKGGKLTITAVLVKISAAALRQFPKFNASIDIGNEEMILKKYIHIGIAVDTENGLLVPVVKDADKKSIIDISLELSELSEKALEGKLSHDEMQGGTFTISNLGGIGGTQFTPIVYHPQVAILGVSKAQKKPVYTDEKFEPREVLPLSLSYDHRLIDGAEGVRFIDWIARALEDPYSALLGA